MIKDQSRFLLSWIRTAYVLRSALDIGVLTSKTEVLQQPSEPHVKPI